MIGLYRKSGRTSRTSFVSVWWGGGWKIRTFGQFFYYPALETTAFSIYPLFVADRRSGYVLVLVSLLLWTLVYFLFFVHFGIQGRLSSDCIWYIHDGWWGGCLLLVN